MSLQAAEDSELASPSSPLALRTWLVKRFDWAAGDSRSSPPCPGHPSCRVQDPACKQQPQNVRAQQTPAAQGTPEIPQTAGHAGEQNVPGCRRAATVRYGWGRYREPPSPPSSPQVPSTFRQRLRRRESFAGPLAPHLPLRAHLSLSAQAAALPLPRGLPAGCHVAPEPRCRSRRRSVSLRVAHLKFQLAGCFHAGGTQNQPANTNKYLLHPPPLQFSFSFLLPSWFWGGNGFSKLSVNVCNNRKRCLLACGRHSFK